MLDMALWDAVAKIEDKPLCAVLAERYGCKAEGLTGYVGPNVPMDRVWVYAAGGYYQPEKDHTKLQEEMQGYLDMGFKTVKMKIGGAPLEEDIERIKAVLEVTGGGGDSLAVDANGRFDLETAKACEDAASYQLRWDSIFSSKQLCGTDSCDAVRDCTCRRPSDGAVQPKMVRRSR